MDAVPAGLLLAVKQRLAACTAERGKRFRDLDRKREQHLDPHACYLHRTMRIHCIHIALQMILESDILFVPLGEIAEA